MLLVIYSSCEYTEFINVYKGLVIREILVIYSCCEDTECIYVDIDPVVRMLGLIVVSSGT